MLSEKKNIPVIVTRVRRVGDNVIPDMYHTFKCESDDVSATLAPEVDCWDGRNPVIIVAPTGKGKTSLAKLHLVPKAQKQGKNVLFVVNRVAIATQLKQDTMKITGSPMLGRLTEQGVRETEIFGNVAVITYHSLHVFINDPANEAWLKNLMYVVADEIHFVVSDSGFCEKAGYYLKILTSKFQRAVRVYMTATDWDVLEPLAEAERANYIDSQKFANPWLLPREFRRYVFPADYSHVKLHFFNDLNEIRKRIQENPNEKWILFMDSKKAGKALAKELGECAVYLDADSKDTESWHILLREKSFTQQVLVTTAVLDCGVNIIDPKLCNVVIISDDRTRLIQMLGRKRCQQGEKVNLFVYDMDIQTITKRYSDGERIYQWYVRYETADYEEKTKMANEIWFSQNEELRHYFALAKGYLVPNNIAFYTLQRKLFFYRSIIDGEITFQSAVRSWLNISEPISGVPCIYERLLHFCEVHLNQELQDEEIDTFRSIVIEAVGPNGAVKTRPDRIDTIGREAINRRLETLVCPYRLDKNAWRIVTIQEE